MVGVSGGCGGIGSGGLRRWCTGLSDVAEDLVDDGGIGDICDHPQGAATAVRCKYPVIAGQIDAQSGDECGEPGEQVQGFK